MSNIRERPKADIRPVGHRCGAASPNRPFVASSYVVGQAEFRSAQVGDSQPLPLEQPDQDWFSKTWTLHSRFLTIIGRLTVIQGAILSLHAGPKKACLSEESQCLRSI